MSYLELWQSMGLFAKSIVVVMLIMSLWYWTITFTKWWYLRKSQKQTAKFAPEFSRFLQEEQLEVAIPAVWLYNFFTTKIDFLTVEMTYSSKELIDYLIKSVGSEFGRSIFTKEFQTQKASQTSGPINR